MKRLFIALALALVPASSFAQVFPFLGYTHINPTVTTSSTAVTTPGQFTHYLIIQNNDPSSNAWVRLDCAAASVNGPGIKLYAGGGQIILGNTQMPMMTATSCVTAISDSATLTLNLSGG